MPEPKGKKYFNRKSGKPAWETSRNRKWVEIIFFGKGRAKRRGARGKNRHTFQQTTRLTRFNFARRYRKPGRN